MKNLLVINLMLIAALCGCTSNSGNPVVECENGRFVGRIEDNGVMSFKGIPYAKASVGELRWKAPQAPEASSETFDAGEFGQAALQAFSPSEIASTGPKGEDCLTLNVTIFGESAGGGSTSCHLVAKGSEGLFQHAVVMSGPMDLTFTEKVYDQWDQAGFLLKATDRSIIPFDPFTAIAQGASKDVDIIVGTTWEEVQYWAHLFHYLVPTEESFYVESRNTMIIGRNASMYMESDPKKEQREILSPYFYDYWINQ